MPLYEDLLDSAAENDKERFELFLKGSTREELLEAAKSLQVDELETYERDELRDCLFTAYVDGSKGFVDYTDDELKAHLRDVMLES